MRFKGQIPGLFRDFGESSIVELGIRFKKPLLERMKVFKWLC